MILAQSDPFTTAGAITLGIASVGALTGIASLAITISQFWLSGARVRVKITAGWRNSTGQVVHGAQTWDDVDARLVGDTATRVVAVSATNRGRMAATINAWGVVVGTEMETTERRLPPNPRLPATVGSSETTTFVILLALIVHGVGVCGGARPRKSLSDVG